LWKFETDPV